MKDETLREDVMEMNRRKKVIENYKRGNKERADEAERIKAVYKQHKDNPALLDALEKARLFADYHHKIAKDGVGMRQNGIDSKGNKVLEEYRLTPEERCGELDQAKGIEQLIAYIDQRINN